MQRQTRFVSSLATLVVALAALLAVGRGPGERASSERGRAARPSAGATPAGPTGPRFDRPDLAEEYYRAKRAAAPGVDPRRAYAEARRRLREMPRHSTRRGISLPPLRSTGAAEARAARALDAWEWLGPGNIGGRTRALVIHPQKTRIMYAGGVSGGVWKTTNGGRRWRAIGDDLANLAVNAMAMDPDDPEVLYVGTGEGYFRESVRGTGLPLRGAGIFKTEDGGETWRQLAATRGKDFQWVNDVAVSPHDDARLYAATRRGVFRTTDGGESWKRVLKTRVRGGCLDLAMRTDQTGDYLLVSCGTFRQASVYLNRAAEGGGPWEKVLSDPGMGRTSLAVAPSDQRVVYALAASNVPGPGGHFEQALHAVFRSEDGGESWEARLRNSDPRKINTVLLSNPIVAFSQECEGGTNTYFAMGWYVNVIAVDPRHPDVVWAGGVDLFRSDDGGHNWNPMTFWWASPSRNFVHADQHGLVFHPKKPGTLLALNDGGIFRTTNAGAAAPTGELAVCQPGVAGPRWKELNNNYGPTQFYHGTPFDGGERFLAGAQDNGTLLGGRGSRSWGRALGGDGGYSAADPTNPNVLYATLPNGVIGRSPDGGQTFFFAINGITDLGEDDLADYRGTVANFLFISPLVMDPDNPQRLWSGGRRLWRTSDGAASWTAASAPLLGSGKASAIAVAAGDSDRVLVGAHDGYVYRSDAAGTADGTSVWSASRPRKGWVSSVAFDPLDPQVVYATYAGFGGRHVWRSVDGGESWRDLDGGGATGVPDIPVHSIVADPAAPQTLYLGTDLGVLVSTDGGDSWAAENTGFANAVTEWLSLSAPAGGARHLFAFTHGRGAWRVELD